MIQNRQTLVYSDYPVEKFIMVNSSRVRLWTVYSHFMMSEQSVAYYSL